LGVCRCGRLKCDDEKMDEDCHARMHVCSNLQLIKLCSRYIRSRSCYALLSCAPWFVCACPDFTLL
jgi:hypothetical protein